MIVSSAWGASLRGVVNRRLSISGSFCCLYIHVLSLGSDIRVETMRVQGLQKRAKKTTEWKNEQEKRYGKVIANSA